MSFLFLVLQGMPGFRMMTGHILQKYYLNNKFRFYRGGNNIMAKNLYTSYYPSPIGILKITFSANNVHAIDFADEINNFKDGNCNGICFRNKNVRDTYNLIYDQLNQYFTGNRTEFDLPIIYNGTNFQVKVWKYLTNIPYGEVRSYKQIAQAIGKPQAARAIGNANRNNPLAIIIPCHRVVAADKNFSGYIGGTRRKKWLIKHEKKYKYGKSLEIKI